MVVSYGVDLRKPRISIDHLLSFEGSSPLGLDAASPSVWQVATPVATNRV